MTMTSLLETKFLARRAAIALVFVLAVAAPVPATSLVPRLEHTAVLLPSGNVFVTGGYDLEPGAIRSSQLYDVQTRRWRMTAPHPVGSGGDIGVLLASGKVLVAHAAPHLYDPATETWSPASPPAEVRSSHTVTLLHSGKVLVVGGWRENSELASAELYDPTTNSWSAVPPMSHPRRYHTATLLLSGKVLVTGGWTSAEGALSLCEIYDPETNSWSTTAPVIGPRSNHSATLLPSGKVLATGGFSFDWLMSAAEYDPASGTWTAVAPLADMMMGHQGILLTSGKVLVPNITEGRNSQLYDPATQTWTPTGSLVHPRWRYTATLLPSGRVLVAGGGLTYSALSMGGPEEYDPDTGTWSEPDVIFDAGFDTAIPPELASRLPIQSNFTL